MKKITLLACLLVSTFVSAQTTFAIYTEDPTIEAGVNSLRFSNGQGFALSEPTTAPYEGTKNFLLTFNGTSSYYHGIMFPRNAANTADASVNLAAFGYYNLALKTASTVPFYIRMRGGSNVIAKVLIDPATNGYGFSNDNQWHFMSIPIADFIPESTNFSLTNVTEIFVLRSNTTETTAGGPHSFEVDNIYASVNEVLDTPKSTFVNFSMFPNPADHTITIDASETIDNITVFNLQGQKIIGVSPATNNFNVDVAALQSGVYLVNVTSGTKTATHKLVKR